MEALPMAFLAVAMLLTLGGGVQLPLSKASASSPKRIAVVGAGASGIAALKAILDLPEEMRSGWNVVAFERRDGIGGVWLPDFDPPQPPILPASPLYPGLRTNGPHPQMTLPFLPLPPETPLLSPHENVLRYHQSVVNTYGLSGYIRLNNFVTAASWTGTEWNMTVLDLFKNETMHLSFDHLIAAPGFNAFPVVPKIHGQSEWLAANKSRLITHCMWYRDPSIYSGRSVAVLGGGPSGWDMVRKITKYADIVYWSRDTKQENPASPGFPPIEGVPDVTRIASLFGDGSVLLVNGDSLPYIDAIVLATGYETRIPFLTTGGHLAEQEVQSEYLTTNGRYIHPLFEHTLSLDPAYPLGALYIGGVLSTNPTGMTSYAQGLFAAYTIACPDLLHPREELLRLLHKRESRIREEGLQPERLGHRWGHGYGRYAGFYEDGPFEDLLVEYLRIRSNGELSEYPGIPPNGRNYTEKWRFWALRHGMDLVNAWHAGIADEGEAEWIHRWSAGRFSEADYVDEMRDVVEWWFARTNATDSVSPSWWIPV